MKIFSSEIGHNYKTYTFGFANYCLREKNDKLSEIYNKGYLPYSGAPDVKNILYMARSARVPLNHFVMTSENRRIAKKFDRRFLKKSVPLHKFKSNDPTFVEFCVDYFYKRHGPHVMPEKRLETILGAGFISNVVSYYDGPKIVGYVFEVADKEMTHFWYSFYDLSLIHQSLGLWLMIDRAREAKIRNEKYFYVGTIYGEKALYKTAFKNLEFWDGSDWVADIKKIKQLGREDNNRTTELTDLWKRELERFD